MKMYYQVQALATELHSMTFGSTSCVDKFEKTCCTHWNMDDGVCNADSVLDCPVVEAKVVELYHQIGVALREGQF